MCIDQFQSMQKFLIIIQCLYSLDQQYMRELERRIHFQIDAFTHVYIENNFEKKKKKVNIEQSTRTANIGI